MASVYEEDNDDGDVEAQRLVPIAIAPLNLASNHVAEPNGTGVRSLLCSRQTYFRLIFLLPFLLWPTQSTLFIGVCALLAVSFVTLQLIHNYFRYHRAAQRNSETRVKSIAFHSEKPWILLSFYSGHVDLWKRDENVTKRFLISDSPVRDCKWMNNNSTNKDDDDDWIVTASDDGWIRVVTPTGQKIMDFPNAHDDYIRYLAVHPTQPLILSAADDLTVKLWDMEYNGTCSKTFQGHNHYVMMVKFHPEDPNIFATASLDRFIKFWDIRQESSALFELEGHDAGVNTIDFCNDNPTIMASGADDYRVHIWHHPTRQLLHKLEGHSDNVSAVLFHPSLPILVSTSEDGTVRCWSVMDPQDEYKALPPLWKDNSKGFGWTLAGKGNQLAVGFDQGSILLELEEDPTEEGLIVKMTNEYNGSNMILEQERVPTETFSHPSA
ncbi:Coatomer subunit beta [Seminavis robusta]|uniref:Coatomer subunit beta n=1 Tax=Seminavis robusta TaxID=568900 RepID=A0A9N8DKD1_9STRA|nr:Coatomer subunit beta [Seminavis robusta]|eukprot:Sro169_g075090.1 Coatomer subunit beta (438) ;mRNA; f:41258-42571